MVTGSIARSYRVDKSDRWAYRKVIAAKPPFGRRRTGKASSASRWSRGSWTSSRGSAASAPPYQLLAVLMSALILLRHKNNIRRLIAGTEPKLGEARTSA